MLSPIFFEKGQRLLVEFEDPQPQHIICEVRHIQPYDKDYFHLGVQFCILPSKTQKAIRDILHFFSNEQNAK